MIWLFFIISFIAVLILTLALLKVAKTADQQAWYDEESLHNAQFSDVEDK